MAELVAKQGETFLLRVHLPEPAMCASPTCTSDEPSDLYVYYFSEDQGVEPPLGLPMVCGFGCWRALQTGPKPIGRPLRYGERVIPGQYAP